MTVIGNNLWFNNGYVRILNQRKTTLALCSKGNISIIIKQ